MTRTLATTTATTTLAACATAAALLSACGGGGDDTAPGGSTSNETAQSASANGVVVADDSVRAQAAVLGTARSVIAVGGAAATVNCAGGGTAAFTATGSSLGNGLLDAGEVYTMQFANCRSSSGSATVTGNLTLGVNSASGESYNVSTTSQVVVGLPQRTLSFNGSSTLGHTVQTSGATQTTIDRWVSPSVAMTSLRNNRITTLSLTNVDLTQTVTRTGGVVTGSSNEGTLTMTYAGWLGTWSATIATQGVVSFNASGVPLSGQWLITLPRDFIALSVAAGIATATLDFGRNGSIDRTLTWLVPSLIVEAD
ncbi:MAG: hypothetical protein KF891_07515 [Rhizobacter sp.]|nr:hypothetical protein [Rhizobacter sp.]